MRFDPSRLRDIAFVVAGVAGLTLEAVTGHHSIALAVPLALVTCLPWLGRERFPLPTRLVTAAGLIACVLVLRAYDVASIAAAALLFFVALDGDRQAAVERLRIARELHDTLAHALVAINVRAGVTAHLGASPDATAAFTEIKNVSAPRDPALGLEAVPRLVQRAEAAGLHAQAELDLNGTAIPSVVDQAGFRIVQESPTNVMRHAHASQARVRIAAQAGELLIGVTDDGQGAPGRVHAGGHGLRGMSERAAAVGGRVAAGPLPGRGWQVRATLPLGVEQP